MLDSADAVMVFSPSKVMVPLSSVMSVSVYPPTMTVPLFVMVPVRLAFSLTARVAFIPTVNVLSVTVLSTTLVCAVNAPERVAADPSYATVNP